MKAISEMLGYTSTMNPRPNPNVIDRTNIPPNLQKSMGFSQHGIILDRCRSLFPWQQSVVNTLSNGQDIYIQAGTGAGKTLPIECYWSNNILGLNTIDTHNPNFRDNLSNLFNLNTLHLVPKLIWLVPIRSLAMEIYNAFRAHFANILAQRIIFNQFALINQIPNAIVQDLPPSGQMPVLTTQMHLPANQQNSVRIAENYISDHVNNLVALRMEDNPRGNPVVAPVTVAIYESGKMIVPTIKRNLSLVVIDEAHELTPKVLDDYDDRIVNKVNALYTILDEIEDNRNCRLAFLTGTIHPDSAAHFCTFLNQNFKRNLRTNIQGGGNRATIDVIADDSLNNKYDLVNIAADAISKNDWGNVFVLFSTNGIKNMAQSLIEKIAPKGLDQIQNKQKQEFTYRINNPKDRKYIPSMSPDFAQSVKIIKEAKDIKDPVLRECVSRGFGYIFRGNANRGDLMDEDDKTIVTNLFKEKKISVLLATDAIGIGVNIDVKKMYIPSVDKYNPNAGGMKEAPLAHLAQVLNRTGRSATPYATIYTPTDNIEYVTQALYSKPEDYDIVPTLDFKNILVSKTGHNPLTGTKYLLFKLKYGLSSSLANFSKNRINPILATLNDSQAMRQHAANVGNRVRTWLGTP